MGVCASSQPDAVPAEPEFGPATIPAAVAAALPAVEAPATAPATDSAAPAVAVQQGTAEAAAPPPPADYAAISLSGSTLSIGGTTMDVSELWTGIKSATMLSQITSLNGGKSTGLPAAAIDAVAAIVEAQAVFVIEIASGNGAALSRVLRAAAAKLQKPPHVIFVATTEATPAACRGGNAGAYASMFTVNAVLYQIEDSEARFTFVESSWALKAGVAATVSAVMAAIGDDAPKCTFYSHTASAFKAGFYEDWGKQWSTRAGVHWYMGNGWEEGEFYEACDHVEKYFVAGDNVAEIAQGVAAAVTDDTAVALLPSCANKSASTILVVYNDASKAIADTFTGTTGGAVVKMVHADAIPYDDKPAGKGFELKKMTFAELVAVNEAYGTGFGCDICGGFVKEEEGFVVYKAMGDGVPCCDMCSACFATREEREGKFEKVQASSDNPLLSFNSNTDSVVFCIDVAKKYDVHHVRNAMSTIRESAPDATITAVLSSWEKTNMNTTECTDPVQWWSSYLSIHQLIENCDTCVAVNSSQSEAFATFMNETFLNPSKFDAKGWGFHTISFPRLHFFEFIAGDDAIAARIAGDGVKCVNAACFGVSVATVESIECSKFGCIPTCFAAAGSGSFVLAQSSAFADGLKAFAGFSFTDGDKAAMAELRAKQDEDWNYTVQDSDFQDPRYSGSQAMAASGLNMEECTEAEANVNDIVSEYQQYLGYGEDESMDEDEE